MAPAAAVSSPPLAAAAPAVAATASLRRGIGMSPLIVKRLPVTARRTRTPRQHRRPAHLLQTAAQPWPGTAARARQTTRLKLAETTGTALRRAGTALKAPETGS